MQAVEAVSDANPTIQWSAADQTSYEVKVKDQSGTAVFTDTRDSTNKALTVTINLSNATAYTVELRIKNADGLYSDTTNMTINVSYTQPPKPVITAMGNNDKEIMTLAITNPTPIGTEPSVSRNEIYRSDPSQVGFTLFERNTAPAGQWIDYTLKSGGVYQYFVRAWGSNGTYRDSDAISTSITFKGVLLHQINSPATLTKFKLDGYGKSRNRTANMHYMQFVGRQRMVADTDGSEEGGISAKLRITADSELLALEKMFESQSTLCYRDGRGRKLFGVMDTYPVEDEKKGYSVTVDISEVDYKEGV